MFLLIKVSAGKYKIVKISGIGASRRLSTLGIFVGDEIEVIKSAPGPVILKKGNLRIGIGQGIAFRITVSPVKGK